MSPKKKTLGDIIKPNEEFGIMVGKDIIPKPTGRGRKELVSQLTIAKQFEEAFKEIAEHGIGVSEEKFGVNC